MAKQIERLEIDLWVELFSYAPLHEHYFRLIERKLENIGGLMGPLRRSSRTLKPRPARPEMDRFLRVFRDKARKIRAIDVDRETLDLLLDRLRQLSAGKRRVFDSRCRVNVDARTFQDYVRRVTSLNARALRARNAFVQANLRLVMTIARRYNYRQIPFQDLIQEGNIGLIKAIGRFDYRRGYRFSTYASWWIRHAISRAIADKGRLVRVPVHMLSTYHKVARVSGDLVNKLGRQPTSAEIGACTDIPVDKVDQIRRNLSDHAFSLDRELPGDDNRRFIELVEDEGSLEPNEKFTDQQVYYEVEQAFEELTPIELDVLRQRFGLADGQEKTLNEIGYGYALSRERIRQIQEQALAKIRGALERRKAV